MTQNKGFPHLLISFVVISLYGCSSFHSQAKVSASPIPKPIAEKPKVKPESLNWLEAFTFSPNERDEALKALAIPTNRNEALLRSILLSHEKASYEELKEAKLLLESSFLSESPEVTNEEFQLRDYLLKLNQVLLSHKLEVSALQEQIKAYRRLIKKQQTENNILENKIEALTDIEHQINLRPDKNPQQVSK